MKPLNIKSEVAPGANVLVHEATFTQAFIDHTREHYGHSNAAAVARFAESAGIPNLVLTHFSARYQCNPEQGASTRIVQSAMAY